MKKSFWLLNKKFLEIKKLDWVKSFRSGSTGIGYTFEKLLGKDEDAKCKPDFFDIEIKTHRSKSNAYITLFNYNPVGNSSYELKRLFNKYACTSVKDKNINVLDVRIYSKYLSNIDDTYYFSLSVDDVEEKIFLVVSDKLGNIIEKESYWTFYTLKEKLYKKMRYLAYVEADSKFVNGCEYFKFNSINFYILRDFDAFLKLIKSSRIRVSFLISGRSVSDESINSHGTSFSIKKENLEGLFKPVN